MLIERPKDVDRQTIGDESTTPLLNDRTARAARRRAARAEQGRADRWRAGCRGPRTADPLTEATSMTTTMPATTVVTTAADLLAATQSPATDIEVQGTLTGMPMITLQPGVRLH